MFIPVGAVARGVVIGALASAVSFWIHAGVKASDEIKQDVRPFALMIGDPAPAFKPGPWVNGQPIDRLEKGKIYVIEFWASWCPPCVAEIPKLTDLQKKFEADGVHIIGITKPDPQNTIEIVSKLVKEKSVGYGITMDDGRAMVDSWLTASGQRMIPTAFIVDREGRVAEILHTDESDLETPLAMIVRGDWNLDARVKSYCMEMTLVAKGNEIEHRLRESRKAKNWTAAIASCDELLALDAIRFANAGSDKFQILLLEVKDPQRAYSFAREVVDTFAKDDIRALNRIAYPIVDPKNNVQEKDLILARKTAERANELAKGKDPYVLQTLARIHFLEGSLEKAIETQKLAANLVDPESKEDFGRVVMEFEQTRRP